VNADELGIGSDYDEDDDELDEDELEEQEELAEEEAEADEGDEEHDLDDEDYQKAAKKRQKQRRLKAMHKIEDIFEPQELERNLLTEFDQQIRLEDKPERFMLRSAPVTSEPDELELDKEAEWIYQQSFINTRPSVSIQELVEPKPPSTVAKIKDVLNFIRNEYFEVPFIANYRKEHILPELQLKDLWKIYEMDEKVVFLFCFFVFNRLI
jgi:transcription elongation factor SPT6